MHYSGIFYNYRTNTMNWFNYDENGKRKLQKEKYVPYFYVNKESKKYDGTSIYGENLVKIQPATWGGYRDSKANYKNAGIQLFESDIRPEMKFLQSKYSNDDLLSDLPKLHIHFLDIETEIGSHFVTGMEASERINLISVYSSKTKQTIVFGLENDFTTSDKSILYVRCENEAELLMSYLKFHSSDYPDIVTGWNIENFDIPYIINRMNKIIGEPKSKKYSPFGRIEYNERAEKFEIAGVAILDYILLYKKFSQGNRERYSLDYICKYEKIKNQKIKFEGTMKEFYQNNWQKFVEYNIMDVRLIVELEERLNFLVLATYLSYASLIPFGDIFSTLRSLDGALLKYCHKKNRIITDRIPHHSTESFKGAYVMEPKPGKYDWVVCWDVTSLYPSIIRMLNISPETKKFKVTNGNYFNDVYPLTLQSFETSQSSSIETKGEMKEFLTDRNLCISKNQILYTKDSRGVIPGILDSWFAERVDVQKRAKFYKKKALAETDKKRKKELQHEFNRLDIQQWALKIRMNSLYGYLGTPYSRFFDWDNSVAVTLTGQNIIKKNKAMLETQFPKMINKKSVVDGVVTYCDTDSLMLNYKTIIEKLLNKKPKTDSEWIGACSKVHTIINTVLTKFNDRQFKVYNADENTVRFEHEAIMKSMILLCKKRYVSWVVYDEGEVCDELKYKGIEIVRSSTPTIFKEYLKDVSTMIIKDSDRGAVNSKIKEIHNETILKTPEELAFPRTANNIEKYMDGESWKKGTPIQIKSSIIYNNLLESKNLQGKYMPIYSGNKMSFLYLKNHRYPVIGFVDQLPKEFEMNDYVDIEVQFYKAFEKPLQQFFDALNWGKINYNTFDLLA